MPTGPVDPAQEKIRQELWRSEAQLALAVEVAGGVGTWDWDLKTDLIYCNERFATLFSVDPVRAATEGVPSSEYIGSIHPEDQHIVIDGTQASIATQCPYVVEFRLPQKDGPEIWIYALGHAYRDSDGNPSRFPGVAMDITQRKHMEAELKVARDQAQTILESITDGFFALDRNFCFTYMNHAAEEILGARREERLGHNLFESYPDVRGSLVQEEYEGALRDQKPRSFEWFFDAWQRWFIIRAYPTQEGGLSVYFRDISEQKKAEELERLRQEQVRESAKLESLGLMAGGIAHDFNNLLTSILGNASLLTELLSGNNRTFATEIVAASERAADLTRQMLAFSGKDMLEVEAIDLNDLVKESQVLTRGSLSRNIAVDLQLSEQPCVIEGDRRQVQQIVVSAFINAAEAIGDKDGKIEIRTGLVERLSATSSRILRNVIPAGRYASFEIRDDGVGMNVPTLKRMFDPFFTTKFTGRGLSLAAVLGIVKGHQGDIEVETHEGFGTAFRVLLPASPLPLPVAQKPEFAAHKRSGKRILIVDDEQVVRKVAASTLETAGFEVVTAADGKEGIEALCGDPAISLVILDLTMPVMNGEQALPLMKSLRPEVPVVLSSGYSEDVIARRFASSGISGFLQKPYSISAILAKVRQNLEILTQ